MDENFPVMNKIDDVLAALAGEDATSLHMNMHELCARLEGDPIGDNALCISRMCYAADRITTSDVAAIESEMKKIVVALNRRDSSTPFSA